LRVLQLSLRNYRVFEELDLELPAKVIGIFGPNGAGKSTLLESFAFACYGVDAARTKKQDIRTAGVLTDCEVRLAFEHGGQEYEVRRNITGRNHAPDAALFAGDRQLAGGTDAVTSEIQKLLRMDVHVFRASVFAEQKQLDAFSTLRKGERKEMVRRLLGIKPLDKAVDAIRSETRAKRAAAETLAGAVEDIPELEEAAKAARALARDASVRAKQALTALRRVERDAKAAIKVFEESDSRRQEVERLSIQLESSQRHLQDAMRSRETSRSRLEALDHKLVALEGLEKELEGIAGAAERLGAARELLKAQAMIDRLRGQLSALPEDDLPTLEQELEESGRVLEAARAAATKVSADSLHASTRLKEAEQRLEKARDADPSEPCPTCGRPLGEDFSVYLKHCTANVKEMKKARKDAGLLAEEAETQVRAAEKDAAERRRALEEARTAAEKRSMLSASLEERLSELQQLASIVGEAEPQIGALEQTAQHEVKLRAEVAALRGQADRRSELEDDLEGAEKSVEEHEATIESLSARLDKLPFDAADHRRLVDARDSAVTELESARATEREAANKAAQADKEAERLEGQLLQAQETRERLVELQDEARLFDRVGQLLREFRDHLAARIGPELSREAEAIFRELTDRDYDDLKIAEDDLSIRIADGDSYFPIERFSGSEVDLANLALRVAISAHLSRVAGADVGLLVLDEVLASLDEDRKDLMVQAMGRLSGRFHQLFVITHAEQVKEQFPASIVVRKVGRRRSVAELV
jgi:exonuclease SbcC